jgi:predicted P-loop ATPase
MRYISFFDNVLCKKPNGSITFREYLKNIKNGTWEKTVNFYRDGEIDKKDLPCFTISGTFQSRSNDGLIEHSGIIAIDIDHKGDELDISKLKYDHYLHAIHQSVGGKGYVAYFLIDPNKHTESFHGLQNYLLTKYNLNIDQACKDVARLRIVSFDPEMTIAEVEPPIFDQFIIEPVIENTGSIVQSSINYPPPSLELLTSIADHLVKESIDITKEYDDWIKIGFAIAHHFGEDGRTSYIKISSLHPKFNEQEANNRYDDMLRKNDGRTSIGSLFYTLKHYGVRTSEIINHTYTSQETEVEHDGIIDETDSQIIEFLKEKRVVRNLVLNRIEVGGRIIEDADVNSMFMECKQYIKSKKKVQKDKNRKNKSISKNMFLTAMESKFIHEYNPFDDFVESLPNIDGRSHLDQLLSSLTYDDPQARIFVEKWLVGLVASLQGIHIVTILVLVGKQNIGKTTFFRHLLPDSLKRYFANAKVDEGKDYMALLASNIIVCDDEFSGKSKRQVVALKMIASQDMMTFREPYGRYNITRKRYALLCATTNDEYVLSDLTGNRRLLPINIQNIDNMLLKSIDKTMLFAELKTLAHTESNYILSTEDIELLKQITITNEEPQREEELVLQYIKKPDPLNEHETSYEKTNTEIFQHLKQKSNLDISQKKLGMALKKHGYEKFAKRINGIPKSVYKIILIDSIDSPPF